MENIFLVAKILNLKLFGLCLKFLIFLGGER